MPMTFENVILAETDAQIQTALNLDDLDHILEILDWAKDMVDNAKYEMEIAGDD
jgi:hypothetical protein